MKYFLERIDLGVDYLDESPWRSFELDTEGNDLKEVITNAHIWEIDRYGGVLRDYSVFEADLPVFLSAMLFLYNKVK